MNEAQFQEIFFALHSDNPREGPGLSAETRRALSFVRPRPKAPRILDVGCGPGAQTLDLLRWGGPAAQVTAVDTYEPYLPRVLERAAAAGLPRPETLAASMESLPFAPASFDLIWGEGSLYSIGFDRALARLVPLLKPGAWLGATELCWTGPETPAERPAEAVAFWAKEYPDMQDVTARLGSFTGAGLAVRAHFVLPDQAWWTHYYRPLERRQARLRRTLPPSPEAEAVFALEAQERALHRAWSRTYGYVFFIAQKL